MDAPVDPAPGHKPRQRESVFLLAQISGPDGNAQSYRVRNLSPDGMCVERPDGLDRDARLTVTIGSAMPVFATVVWSRNGFAGLQFLRRIDPELARKRPPKSLDPRVGWGRASGL